LLQNGFEKFCGQGPSKEIGVPDLQQSQWLRQLWLEEIQRRKCGAAAFSII
jgi:hypothetical protein